MREAINAAARRVPLWAVWLTLLALPVGQFLLAAAGASGPDPVRTLERDTGRLAFELLIATLAITPLRRWAGLNLLRFRRPLGVATFWAALIHAAVWAGLDVALEWPEILRSLAGRPYILLGALALLVMAPLAATSTDRAIRRMGARRWRQLHRLVYAIAVLGILHWVLLAKVIDTRLLVHAGLMGILLLARLAAVRGAPIPGSRPARRGR